MFEIETINRLAVSWMNFMWFRSIDTLLVFLFVGSIWFVIRRKISARFGYWLFLLVLIKPIAPSMVSIPTLFGFESNRFETIWYEGQFGWWGGDTFGTAEEGTSTSAKDSVPSPATNLKEKPNSTVSLLAMLMIAWLSITAILLLRLSIHQWMTRKKMRQTKPIDLNASPIDLIRLQEIAQVKTSVNWVHAAWTHSPLVWGIIHPAIVVPTSLFKDLSPNQLRWVLLHELAHIRRRDNLVSLFQSILQIVFFFHPAVWIANMLIDQQREYACDDDALAGSKTSRRECGEGFLETVFHAASVPDIVPATLGLINYKTMIRRRLMRILSNKQNLKTVLSWSSKLTLIALVFLIVPFSWKVALAQMGEFIKLEPTTIPFIRAFCTMTYIPTQDLVLLYGARAFENQTWIWDGVQWSQVEGPGPEQGSSSGMVYDSKHNQVVLFGGGSGTQDDEIKDETWIWDPESREWSYIDVLGPSPRVHVQMAYDSTRGQIFLHGGWDGVNPNFGDTWIWDGDSQTWTDITAGLLEEHRGPQIANTDIVYDSHRDRMVMFGGIIPENGTGNPVMAGNLKVLIVNTVWEWDGSKWEEIPVDPANWPPARAEHGTVYNPLSKKVVIYGGTNGTGITYDDMWEWDGAEWTQIDLGNQPRPKVSWAPMVFLSNQNALFVYGGILNYNLDFAQSNTLYTNDTWLYQYDTASGLPFSLWSMY